MNSDDQKPFLRGHFHQAAFFFGLGACAMLIPLATTPSARLSAIIYTLSLLVLFGTSSLYHRIIWPPKIETWVRKLDHSAIFIFIAGTGTPICILGLPGQAGQDLMTLFWTFAFFGILKEFLWKKAPRWSAGIFYVLMGWMAVPYIGRLEQSLGWGNIWFLLSGGIVYTLGALVYSFRWPDPFPKIFGFHEIFHALVIIAGVLHFLVIYNLVSAAGSG